MLDWVIENKEWVFGGVGVAIISAAIKLIFGRKPNGISQSQTSGSNSTNVQAGKDVNLYKEPSKPDDG